MTGRGRRQRFIPLWEAARYLRRYLHHRPRGVASRVVFVDENARRLTPREVSGLLERLAKQAGISELSADRLRATLATRLYQDTTSIEAVQDALGLADLNSAARYVRRSQEEVLAIHRQHSPLAAMLKGKDAQIERAVT